MKAIIKNKVGLKKILGIAVLCLGVNEISKAQCNASFTYTVGANGSVTFTSSNTNASAYTGWMWGDGTGILAGGNFTSHTYTYNGTYQVMSNVTNPNVTSDTCSSTETIVITNATPVPACNANFTYTVGTNGNVTFTSLYAGNPSDISWDLGDHTYISYGYSTSNLVTNNYTYNGTYIVTSTIYNYGLGLSCTSTQTLIITNGLPAPPCNAAFTYTINANGNVNFTSVDTTNPALGIGNTWSLSTGAVLYGSNPSYNFPSNGTYTVTLSASDSANAQNCSTSQVIVINNDSSSTCIPAMSFYMTPDSSQLHTYLAIPTYAAQDLGAIWNWGDGTVTSGLYPSHTYSVAANYHICVTVFSACGDTAVFCQNDSLYRTTNNTIIRVNVQDATTGIKAQVAEQALSALVYPNPSTGVFTLQLTGASSESARAQVNISNILGEIIYSTQESLTNKSLTKEIDLQNMANGAYFMQISIGGKTKTQKIIINK